MKKGFLLVSVMLIIVSLSPLFADDYYEKGNTFFSIKAGISVPVFGKMFNDPSESLRLGSDAMHLKKVGGVGTLSYQGCVSPRLAIGAELGYFFNNSFEYKYFTQVPITFKATYIPVQTGKFDVNIVGNIGFEFLRYNNSPSFSPYVGFSINPVFYVTEKWGIGLDAGAGLNCELFTKTAKKDQNTVAMFAPVTLSITYRK